MPTTITGRRLVTAEQPRLGNSAETPFAVTPSDTEQFPIFSEYFFVGNGGDVSVLTIGGGTVLYENVPDGGHIFVVAAGVMATGTDATGIVGHY